MTEGGEGGGEGGAGGGAGGEGETVLSEMCSIKQTGFNI